jgi:hypothetical protein
MYGFWLPNDPRGSWSETIRKWQLVRYGPATRTQARRALDALSPAERAMRDAARAALKYPPVTLTGTQVAAIARGVERQAAKKQLHDLGLFDPARSTLTW